MTMMPIFLFFGLVNEAISTSFTNMQFFASWRMSLEKPVAH